MRQAVTIGGNEERLRFGDAVRLLKSMRAFRYEPVARIRRALWRFASDRPVIDGHAPAPSYRRAIQWDIQRIIAQGRRAEWGVRTIYALRGRSPDYIPEDLVWAVVNRRHCRMSEDWRYYSRKDRKRTVLRPRCAICPSFLEVQNREKPVIYADYPLPGVFFAYDSLCHACARKFRTSDPTEAALRFLKKAAA